MEADFQQYYNLDLCEISQKIYAKNLESYEKYLRLFVNLPIESRIMRKKNLGSEFDFQQQTFSRILFAIENFSAMYYNGNRDKNAKPMLAPKFFIPEKIREMMDEYDAAQKAQKSAQADISRDFWREFNGI